MGRACTICQHPAREAIDLALAAGQACRQVAAVYRVSPDAVERHYAAHLPPTLAKAQDARETARADDLLGQVRELQARTLAILGKAEVAEEWRTALAAIREARSTLELLAKLTGELAQEGAVNLVVSPEWLAVRAALLQALAPFPEARVVVAGALVALEAAPPAGAGVVRHGAGH